LNHGWQMKQGEEQGADFFEKNDTNSDQGSQVQADIKQKLGFFDAEKVLKQDEMTGAAYR